MNLANRYDFVLIFDVKDGNPNGDPDAGNMPRMDAESGHGLVTDVSLKRKIRNFIGLVKADDNAEPAENAKRFEEKFAPGEKRFEIYVREKAILNLEHQRAYSALNLAVEPEESAEDATENVATDAKKKKPVKEKRKGSADEVGQARKWMCQNFFDVRTFGAVMSTWHKLRPSPWPGAAYLCPLGRTHRGAGTLHYPHGCSHRGRGRKAARRQPHYGPQAHRALRRVCSPRLRLLLPSQANRVWRRRP
jgi:hypothetical protein